MKRVDHTQGTRAAAQKGAHGGPVTPRRARSEEDGGSPGAGAGAGGSAPVRKVASPSVITHVRGATRVPPARDEDGDGGGGTAKVRHGQAVGGGRGRGHGGGGGDDDEAKKKREKKDGFLTQVTKGVGKLFGMSADGKEESTSSSSSSSRSPATGRKPQTRETNDVVTTKKWFGQSFVEMFGLKATTVTRSRHGRAGEGAGGETLTTSTHQRTNNRDAGKGDDKHDSSTAPETIWVRGTKAEGYRVNVVRSSSLRKLRGLFSDMDADRDGHITFDEFRASLDASDKAPGLFQRDVFDKISNDADLCTYDFFLQVLYPGASPAQTETMLAMSHVSGGEVQVQKASSTGRGDKKGGGPSAEQIKEAEHLFYVYDVNKDGVLSEDEFVKGLTATGVYAFAEASKEFDRMDGDDNSTVDLREFTRWYAAMDDIGRRVRRNA